MNNTDDKPVTFKPRFFLRRRYLWHTRYPFDFLYTPLVVLGILFATYVVYANLVLQGMTRTNILFGVFILTVSVALWVGLFAIIRWVHRDSRWMYKRLDFLVCYKKRFKLVYAPNAMIRTGASQSIGYSSITDLTLLTDIRSGLPVLQVDAAKVEFAAEYEGRYFGTGTLYPPESRRYFPLYYKNSDQFIQLLLQKTGLPLKRGTVHLHTLREKKLEK